MKSAHDCIFCGAPVSSKEHLFPKWARELIGTWPDQADDVRHLADFGSHGHQYLEQGEGHFPRRVRVVCQDCNGDWMKQLDIAARVTQEPVALGKASVVFPEDARLLAAWGFKTSLVLERTAGLMLAPSTEEARAHALAACGEPDDNVRVWVGRYEGRSGPTGWSQRPMRFLAREDDDRYVESTASVTMLTIGQALTVVTSTGHPAVPIERLPAEAERRLHPVWPTGDDEFRWEGPGFSPEELARLSFVPFHTWGMMPSLELLRAMQAFVAEPEPE